MRPELWPFGLVFVGAEVGVRGKPGSTYGAAVVAIARFWAEAG